MMEFISGGEMLEQIVHRGHYSERDAAVLVRQIVSTVEYLHSQGVCDPSQDISRCLKISGEDILRCLEILSARCLRASFRAVRDRFASVRARWTALSHEHHHAGSRSNISD
eukprot:SAG31_NODE_3909_length_3762_cov_2.740923_3_plen_111_part_00